ncbi:MAG TPA: hypothetical protein VK176_06740 [Phycisphaerales bacterium]|nr:hypothetical protein [Phycisphaerales bacterium]
MNRLVRSESTAPPPIPTGRTLIEETEEQAGQVGSGYKCPKCGYNLRGLKGVQCPECGTQVRGRSSGSHALQAIRDESQQTVRWAYMRPAIAVGVGLVAIFIIRLVQGNLGLVHKDLVHYLVRVPAATGAYYLCCFAFIGFNAPFHLTVLRNAGTCAIISACYSFFLDPLRAVPVAVLCGVYVFLMWEEMQLDLQEAWIVAATALGAMAIATYLANVLAGW